MNYALVGAFVLALGAALVVGMLWLAAGGATRQAVDLYLAVEEESVAGLNLNAPVKFNGVDVGKVRSITLDRARPDHVRLVFAIERGTPVSVDTVAVLKTQGLTGIAYVELSGGAAGAPPLRATAAGEYPQIRTKPSLGTRLETVLTKVLTRLDSLSANVDAILSEDNRRAVAATLADVAALSHTLAARRGSIDDGITSAARTLANAERASAQLAPLLARLAPVLEQLGPTVAGVQRSAAAVQVLGEEASEASRSARQAADALTLGARQFSGSTLPELQGLLLEMNALAASVHRLSEQTQRDPAGLLFGRRRPTPGPGEAAEAAAAERGGGAAARTR